MGGQDPVVDRQRGQGGLAHAQGHRHGMADVQRLVEGQSAQAVGVEVVRREKRLRAQERRLQRGGEGFQLFCELRVICSVSAVFLSQRTF